MSAGGSVMTLTRHASYDELVGADFRGLQPAVWAALRDGAGVGPDPGGAAPPVYGILAPAPTYRVPPPLGDRVLAARPAGDGLRLVDRRAPPAVTPDPARVAHRAPHFRAAVRAVAGVPRALVTADDPTRLYVLAAALPACPLTSAPHRPGLLFSRRDDRGPFRSRTGTALLAPPGPRARISVSRRPCP
jgi:hypothetical protein